MSVYIFQRVYVCIFRVGGCGVCGPCESCINRCVWAGCGRQLSTSGLGANLMLTNISGSSVVHGSSAQPRESVCWLFIDLQLWSVSHSLRVEVRVVVVRAFPALGLKTRRKVASEKRRQEEEETREKEGGLWTVSYSGVSEWASYRHTAWLSYEWKRNRERVSRRGLFAVCCGYVVCVFERGHIQVFPSGVPRRFREIHLILIQTHFQRDRKEPCRLCINSAQVFCVRACDHVVTCFDSMFLFHFCLLTSFIWTNISLENLYKFHVYTIFSIFSLHVYVVVWLSRFMLVFFEKCCRLTVLFVKWSLTFFYVLTCHTSFAFVFLSIESTWSYLCAAIHNARWF